MGQTLVDAPFEEWFVLDHHYVIVDGLTRRGVVERRKGQTLWEAFPGAFELYGRFYAEAWDRPMQKLEFHFGTLIDVEAQEQDGCLHVRYRILAELDVTTWDSLRRSVDRMEDLLAEAGSRSAQVAAAFLRLV